MSDNNSVYMPHQNKTYIYGNDGNLLSIVDGDQSNNQALTQFAARSANSLGGSKGGRSAEKQNTKDFAVNLASQVPLAFIPGSGAVPAMVKGGSSLLSGLVADRVLNPDKSMGDSAADAGVNTLVGMITNHMINSPPSLKQFYGSRGFGIKGILDGIIRGLAGEEIYPELTPQTPVVRGAKGQFVSNMKKYNIYIQNKAKRDMLGKASNIAGFGLNDLIDASNNQQQ